MINLDFKTIKEAVDKFTFPKTDLVIGIAEGGLVPSGLVAYKLGCELKVIKINLRDENNTPKYNEPKILFNQKDKIFNKRILLVDDVSVTGKTLESAKTLFPQNEITSFVLKGKGDLVLFPGIKECVNWPWKIF